MFVFFSSDVKIVLKVVIGLGYERTRIDKRRVGDRVMGRETQRERDGDRGNEREFTIGRHIGESLVLAPFPLAIAHIEVHLNRTGYPLVPIRRDFNVKRCLQCKVKGNASHSETQLRPIYMHRDC
jgi:hypothetical protein